MTHDADGPRTGRGGKPTRARVPKDGAPSGRAMRRLLNLAEDTPAHLLPQGRGRQKGEASAPVRWYLGVDPGASGGFALIDHAGVCHELHRIPEKMDDLWSFVRDLIGRHDSGILQTGSKLSVALEKVGGFIAGGTGEGGDGGTTHNKASAHTMFNFGMGYGALRMAFVVAGCPVEDVRPQTWQGALGLPPRTKGGAESKTAFKRRLREHAQALFPEAKVIADVADALLIAEYLRRKTGEPT